MKGPALVVMARAPVVGRVKTRLQPALTIDQCANIYRAFLKDTVSTAVALPQYTPFLAFTPRTSRKTFEGFVPAGKIELISQTGRNLGQRMYNVMRHLEDRDYSPVVLIGSDIPTLQPSTLTQAVEVLKNSDLCLGPSSDGGYYLIGANQVSENIFRGVEWSTSRVLETTICNAKEAGQSLALLEVYFDVDTFADVQRLYEDIKRLRATSGAIIPLHTKNWLEETAVASLKQHPLPITGKGIKRRDSAIYSR